VGGTGVVEMRKWSVAHAAPPRRGESLCYHPILRRLAIVVPTLDEEEALARTLPSLTTLADEVVVSDGGSTDATTRVASAAGATVVEGSAGRGPQLNRGAAATSAETLVFLHADTTLPPGAIEAIHEAIAAGASGGGFLVHFDHPAWLYRVAARLINLRTRLTRAPLGDQAQFVTRDAFAALGGYENWPILEDLDFALRLRRHGGAVVIRRPVVTSARRYSQRGFARTVLTNWLIWTLFVLGVSPQRLATLYRQVR